MRSRSILVGLVVALTSTAAPAWAEAAGQPKPNFVFILIDDMGWKDLGCQGSTFYETPHCDQLAAQGMRFTNAYAACPVCSPTRASILTGKYPARLHLTDWLPGWADAPSRKLRRPQFRQFLPREEVTLAEALKPAGYTTASIGKWHLGGKGHSPRDQGFDINIAGAARGSPPSYFFPYKNKRDAITDLADGKEGEYLTDRLTTEAEKFIEQNKDRPFFLYLAHHAVHVPHQAKKDVIAKYRSKAKPSEGQSNAVYAAMVESVDDSVGRIMKKLQELKLADRTVLIFTSDNGGLSSATSNAPLRAGKGHLYEGGIREPLLVKWPGVTKPASVCDVPVLSMDFFPTILEIAGAQPDPKQAVDGVSLVPLLKQAGAVKREALYWHYPHYSPQGGRPAGAIRQGDFKLIEFYEDGKLELYHLKGDVGEKNDLAAKLPDKAKELQQLLKDWRKAVDAQMPTPNADYQPPKDK